MLKIKTPFREGVNLDFQNKGNYDFLDSPFE